LGTVLGNQRAMKGPAPTAAGAASARAGVLVAEALRQAEEGALSEAQGLLLQAGALEPLNPVVLHELGRLLMRRELFMEAVASLTRAVRLEPADAAIYADLGAALAAAGELETALVALEKAAEFDADNETAREGLAIVRGMLAGRPAGDASEPAGVAGAAGRALVYMTARDCELYVAPALQSLARQTHDNIHVLFIDDASGDDTGVIAERMLRDLFPEKHTFIRNEECWGKARNAWHHLRPRVAAAEFVAVLDGDDQLVEPAILARIAASYRDGKDVVWTNYTTDRGGTGPNTALRVDVDPRKQGWKTSHFFTFRGELLQNVPETYFRDSGGEWLSAACDIALALPILDQTRRYEFIPVEAYRYTSTNPNSHHNLDPLSRGFNSTNQQRCAHEVFAKDPLPLTRPVEAEPEPVPAPAPDARAGDVVSEAPAMPAAAAVPTEAWHGVMATRLAAVCPAILDAASVAGADFPSPAQVLALHRIVQSQGRAPRVLHVGPAAGALAVAALAAAAEGEFTCLCPVEDAAQLRARLRLCGLQGTIRETEAAALTVAGITGPFADPAILADGAMFDVVVADTRAAPAAESAAVAFPALANHLASDGFAFALLGRDRQTERFAAEVWSRLSEGLSVCADAVGGSGLLVVPG